MPVSDLGDLVRTDRLVVVGWVTTVEAAVAAVAAGADAVGVPGDVDADVRAQVCECVDVPVIDVAEPLPDVATVAGAFLGGERVVVTADVQGARRIAEVVTRLVAARRQR